MKKLLPLLLLVSYTLIINAQYTWIHMNNFGGTERFKTAGFSINGKGYMVAGRTSTVPVTYISETLEYDEGNDTWTAKAAFPFAVAQPSAFAIGNKGYVVGGNNSSFNNVNSCYEFDPTANTWTSKAAFPESGIGGAFQFVINDKAYVGTGARAAANNSNSFYEYNPVNNTWTAKANFTGSSRVNAVGFAIGNFGYAGLGTDGNDNFSNDFYKYDPANNTWTKIADFPGKARFESVAFVLNDKAYVGGGAIKIGNTYVSLGDFYEFDPIKNSWLPVSGISGPGRANAAHFVIGNSAYVAGGYAYEDEAYFNFVEKITDCNELSTSVLRIDRQDFAANLYPNPSSNVLNVALFDVLADEFTYDVVSVSGKTVMSGKTTGNNFQISTDKLASGAYVLSVKDGLGSFANKRFEIIR